MPAYASIADYKQTITINGDTLEKEATELTFDGDNVILHFSDETTQTCDMSEVSIAFNEPTSIESIKTFNLKGATNGEFEIGGLVPGQSIQIYDISGKKIFGTKSTSETQQIDISNVKSGTYILRVGSNVVKFVKR